MRKCILSVLIILASSVLAKAQIASGQSLGPGVDVVSQDVQYIDRLSVQNHLLNNRKAAQIVSLSGVGISIVSGILCLEGCVYEVNPRTGENQLTKIPVAPLVGIAVGEAITLTGAIWLVVNEFKMIDAQKKINEQLILRYSPTGIKLMF